MQQKAPTDNTASTNETTAPAVTAAPIPRPTSGMNPLHSKTESTLAPTSEYVRILLLAMGVRYILRGGIGEVFDSGTFDRVKNSMNKFLDWGFVRGSAKKIGTVLEKYSTEIMAHKESGKPWMEFIDANKHIYKELRKPLRSWRINASEEAVQIFDEYATIAQKNKPAGPPTWNHELYHSGAKTGDEHSSIYASKAWKRLRDHIRGRVDDALFGVSLSIGGAWLSLTYSNLVRNDIKNIFSEAVGYEKGIAPDQVKFDDISQSSNRIIQRTVHNYWTKLAERLAVDALFLPAAAAKSMPLVEMVIGGKIAQALGETWKRKPTLFEDMVGFVNNKINPRNGLGQPITVSEIFDLYQHYAEQFSPDRMFSNVVERGTGEGAIWADSQIIFKHVAELMNLTYAYKHQTMLDTQGNVVPQANFPLPKLIYLLGHDLIDTRNPETTLAYIEIANRHGMEAVKEMQTGLAQGKTLEQFLEKYPIPTLITSSAVNAPLNEPINSITQVNHADRAFDKPATTISSERAISEHALASLQTAQAAV